MKKRVIIVLSVLAFFIILFLVAVFINFPLKKAKKLDLTEDIIMTIKQDTLTRTSATILLTNNSDVSYSTGRGYRIDTFKDGKWYTLSLLEDMIVTADALGIDPDNPLELTLYWERSYGELENGQYRIVKSVFTDDRPLKDKDVIVEFTIK
ncbi:MAG: hypothetical protein K2M17_04950 [Bacilli bacterium]|nr:hypothetical protein [Bacilli bacterium]